jgi:putative two-component system response regulator
MSQATIDMTHTHDRRHAAANGNGGPGLLLVVEDDPAVRGMLGHVLTSAGYPCETTGDVQGAEELLGRGDVLLLITDVQLHDRSGIDLLGVIDDVSPDTATIVVTGLDDPSVADLAIERGAYGYLVKPFGPSELLIQIRNALRRRRLELAARDERSRLEHAVELRTSELRGALESLRHAKSTLRQAQGEMIKRLAAAVEARDHGTAQHIERVSAFARTVSLALGLSEAETEVISEASVLHDVGKIALRDGILLKAGPLSDDERREIERHPFEGWRILSGSGLALLDTAAAIARSHHERWDGSGYPVGLAGEEIPLEGRIVAVVDVFDALTSDRPYRPALGLEAALEIVRAGAGSHFDPSVVDAFFASLDEILAIRERAHALHGPNSEEAA